MGSLRGLRGEEVAMATTEAKKVEVRNPCVECHGEIRKNIEQYFIFQGFRFHARCWAEVVRDFGKIGIHLADDQEEE